MILSVSSDARLRTELHPHRVRADRPLSSWGNSTVPDPTATFPADLSLLASSGSPEGHQSMAPETDPQTMDERWTAWQAKGAAGDLRLRRRARVACVALVLAGLVAMIWKVLFR